MNPITSGKTVTFPPDEATRRRDNVFLRDINVSKFFILNCATTFGLEISLFPLDVVRTRLQVQNRTREVFPFRFRLPFSSYFCVLIQRVGDMFRMFRSLIAKEGVRGLFSGLTPSCMFCYYLYHK